MFVTIIGERRRARASVRSPPRWLSPRQVCPPRARSTRDREAEAEHAGQESCEEAGREMPEEKTPPARRRAPRGAPHPEPGQHQHHVETPRATPTRDARSSCEPSPSPAEPAATPAPQPTPVVEKVSWITHNTDSRRRSRPIMRHPRRRRLRRRPPCISPRTAALRAGRSTSFRDVGNLYGIRVGLSEST